MWHWLGASGWSVDPAWITAIVALCLCPFTIYGVLTARKEYVRGIKDARKAVARLVWVERRGPTSMPQGGSKVVRQQRHLPRPNVRIDTPSLYETIQSDGRPEVVWATDALRIYAKITNHSTEPVGRIGLRATWGRQLVAQSVGRFIEVLPPDTTKLVEILIPNPSGEIPAREVRLTVRFTDSAGHRWKRTGMRPPEEENAGSQRAFPRMRGWEFPSRLRLGGPLTAVRLGARDGAKRRPRA